MTYEETIRSLFNILCLCNAADADDTADWQEVGDANGRTGAYGHINKAIEALAGRDVIECWCETGEIDLTLCNRTVSV